MKKFYLSEGNINKKSTGAIAKVHIEEFLSSSGYVQLQYKYLDKKNLLTKVIRLLRTFIWILTIPSKAIVFFHFPITPQAYRLLLKSFFFKRVFTVAIIHDLNGLRFDNNNELQQEKRLLQYFNQVIVHNSKMHDYLQTILPTNSMNLLWLFDYKTKSQKIKQRELKLEITIAASLEKTHFLNQVLSYNGHLSKIKIFIYGTIPKEYVLDNIPTNIVLKGTVPPEELPMKIEGSFGIVWDGYSLNTCAGTMGNYLRYNSPHKLSLYLAAGMPVIVWEQSAMAKWVIENNVGIIVKSWAEAINKIEKMDTWTYAELCRNSKEIGTRLRNGEFLKRVIKEIEAKAMA